MGKPSKSLLQKERLKRRFRVVGAIKVRVPMINFFIKKCWALMKENFFRCFMSFYLDAFLSRSCASSFMTLIPKSSNPLGLNDYKLICLIGCIYKAISKLLASRLKLVINSIVSQCRSPFVPGRQRLDGNLLANDLVDYAKREGKYYLFFKVDFKKAYDMVNWNFLRFMLKNMSFGEEWMSWMKAIFF